MIPLRCLFPRSTTLVGPAATTFRVFTTFGFVAVLLGCSSGQTAFRHQRYDEAVTKAAHRLQQRRGWSERGHALATLVLEHAFRRSYEQRQAAIRALSQPDSRPFRWEAVYAEYVALQNLTRQATTCQPCANWLAAFPADYADRLRETRQLAAADRYDYAERAFALREDNREAAKEAYLNYHKALEWVPNYRHARGRAADALPYAVLRVVIEPLTPTRQLGPADERALQQQLFRGLARADAPSPFVRFYPPDEQAGDGYGIHQTVQMAVTDYDPYDDRVTSSCRTVESDKEYKVGEKKINDSTTVDVMEKVTGTLTTYTRTVRADLSLRLRGVDVPTGNVLWEEQVWETRSWRTEWEEFRGDARALNGHSPKTASLFVPSAWSLFSDLKADAAASAIAKLHRRYAHQ